MIKIECEIWKDIKGYENKYQVSNLGRIKSLTKCGEKILKHLKNNKGYMRVNLYINSKRSVLLIHRLMAETFIPNPNQYEFVHHIDGDPTNNSIKNLEWMDKKEHQSLSSKGKTRSQESIDKIKTKNTGKKRTDESKQKYSDCKKGSKNINAKLDDNLVREIKKVLNMKKYSQYKIARMFNINQATISLINNNKAWSHVE